ncbi:Lipopolysaccharide biosynthesis protein WzxC [Oceanibacterium hippocampi]|uniref:Lipopolysaccharide biosynthesis protein WzxC n=2 Tax=Oceanibacterium hippocampi TaxID=745714 RepID=A0A1Y5TPM7_9PROT|nr:Lipopolysaccharide biosynthesis protein WzxC [Oceanibacterium hippocampi]
MARGAFWMIAMNWSMRLIGLVNTMILARLLVPEDFGIIAMSMVVVGFLHVFSEANVDLLLLRKADVSEADYNSAWTLRIMTGIVVMVLLMAVAPLFADYANDPRVTVVIQILALRSGLLGFENIGVVRFRKELNFRREFLYQFYRRIIYFVVGLIFVLALRNYYALAVAPPLAAVIAVIISYRMSPFRPKLDFSRVGQAWNFSRWLILLEVARFVANRTDNAVLSRTQDATALGNYFVAVEIATMPTRELVMPLTRALFPTFSKVAHDPEQLRTAFLQVMSFVSTFCIAAGLGMALVADHLVPVMLGSKWSAAIPFFFWFAIYGVATGIIQSITPFFVVIGRERTVALLDVAYIAVLVPTLIYLGNTQAIVAVAIGRVVCRYLYLIFVLAMMRRFGGVPVAAIVGTIWRPALAGLAMAATLNWLPPIVAPDLAAQTGMSIAFTGHLLSLVEQFLVGAFVYLGTVCLLWVLAGRPAGAESVVLGLVGRRLAARRSS